MAKKLKGYHIGKNTKVQCHVLFREAVMNWPFSYTAGGSKVQPQQRQFCQYFLKSQVHIFFYLEILYMEIYLLADMCVHT